MYELTTLRGIPTRRGSGGRAARRLLAAALTSLSLLIASACSSDDPVDPVRNATFTSSGSAASADFVRLTGRALDDSTVRVSVVLNGPSTSSDLYSFAFDLVLSSSSVVSYIDGSAVPGDVLVPDAGQDVAAIVSQQRNRVVVAVSKFNGGAGNGIQAGEHALVSLDFHVELGASTVVFAGSPVQGVSADPAALDSSNAVVPSVRFDDAAAGFAR